MTTHPLFAVLPKRSRVHPRFFRIAAAVTFAIAEAFTAADAVAQATPTAVVERTGFLRVLGRIDPVGLTLGAVALVIVVLLVLRIWATSRRDRPARRPVAKRRSADDDSLDRATMSGPTDWGFDQNKRSAQSRDAALGPAVDLSSGQWSASEVYRAGEISKQANDSMGKPPDMPASPYRTAFNPYYHGDTPHPSSVEVVEVADTLLQAELLVQLGDPKQAMTLLSNHIRETEKPGPAVWLMLLNLYQTTGRKSQYEALAKGFSTLFNAAVPAWAEQDAAARDLETYSQVMLKLHTDWGKPSVRPILEAMLNDDRGGSRQGFSLGAYRELLFLIEIVAELEKMAAEQAERDSIQRKLGRAG